MRRLQPTMLLALPATRLPEWLLALALVSLSVGVHAQNPVASEYDLKAAYLYHFIQFTDWPERELTAQQALTICIDAKHPLLAALSALHAKIAHGLPISVEVEPRQNFTKCQVLVIDRDAALVRQAEHRPILTVSDDPQMTLDDVIVSLRMKDDRVIFAINKTRAEATGLQISSRLLRLAETVR